jgi:hypothetical protein
VYEKINNIFVIWLKLQLVMQNPFCWCHKNNQVLLSTIVVFLHMSVGLLNFVTETQQQQGNIIHTTATLSQARWKLAATSSGELVFFAGGRNSTGPSDRVDIYDVTSGSWTTTANKKKPP